MDTELSTALVRLASLEQRLVASERRLRVIGGVALAGMVGAFALGLTPQARAQYGVTLAALDNRLKGVEFKTKFMSVSGATTLFTKTNVQIVSGSGGTGATVNGLGNLIVGYNEFSFFGNVRSGSHNLVLGDFNNYSSYGGIIAGLDNTISAPYASVLGGSGNRATGDGATVSGGTLNIASGPVSAVGGGTQNQATGDHAAVSGGKSNQAFGSSSSVSGGRNTVAIGAAASVSGGAFVSAPFDDSWRAGALHTP